MPGRAAFMQAPCPSPTIPRACRSLPASAVCNPPELPRGRRTALDRRLDLRARPRPAAGDRARCARAQAVSLSRALARGSRRDEVRAPRRLRPGVAANPGAAGWGIPQRSAASATSIPASWRPISRARCRGPDGPRATDRRAPIACDARNPSLSVSSNAGHVPAPVVDPRGPARSHGQALVPRAARRFNPKTLRRVQPLPGVA